MRATARLATAAALLATLLACAGVFTGCAGGNADVHSEVPGIELVQTPGQDAAWSPNGRLIALLQGHWIKFAHPDGSAAGRVKAPRADWEFTSPEALRFSADGRVLFYVTDRGSRRDWAVKATRVRRDDGGVAQTSLGTRYADANFAAHGWPLAYATAPYEFGLHGNREGPSAGVWKLSGPGAKPQRLARVDGIPKEPVVGAHDVLFKQWLHEKTELWTVGLDGSDPHRLARFIYARHYEFAPRGNDIAFAATPHRPHSYLYLLVAGQGRPRRVGRGEVHDGPVWSPDGRWLVFSTPAGQIRRVHPDGRGEETIATFDGEEVEWLAFSPDGRRLLYGAHPPFTESSD
jgi:hypothetical protein